MKKPLQKGRAVLGCARAHGPNSLPCLDDGRQKKLEAEDEETSPEAPCGPRVLPLQLESAVVPLGVPLAELVLPAGSVVANPLLQSLRTADLLPASAGTTSIEGTVGTVGTAGTVKDPGTSLSTTAP
ncbi:hypothetical protein Taro_023250 [Colocasia esculenta]|uniref:Uncharacterized protein n=1 Tax=Colocasia esculenta TaxID=4460 RepID=A0A843VAT1_COLES|nr:hypothetical protein [Colocasia esculenta]